MAKAPGLLKQYRTKWSIIVIDSRRINGLDGTVLSNSASCEMSFITSEEGGTLTDLHWTVIAIARTDLPRSAEPEGRLMRFLRRSFGEPAAPKLASGRLEALRCFCVRAWHRDAIRWQDVRALIEAGYARSAAVEVLVHIASCRSFAPALEEQAT